MMIMNMNTTAAGGEAGASVRRNGPFTATQWQQLEHQALAYKYMISGLPIPPHLLFTIKSHHHQPHHPSIGWKMMGFGRKEIRIINDPEPGRCRRTDGKKWRCSKEAYTDSKYCQRHMHRGRNRSRKQQPTVVKSSSNYHNNNNNNINHVHVSSNHLLLDSSPYRKRYGMKQEHSFFSESSGTINTSFTQQTTLSGYCDQLALKLDGKDEPQKVVMHHFFDEWPQNHKESSTTKLSISIPSSAHHCN